MAKTDPRLANWMVIEVEAELDREYVPEELAKEIASRIEGMEKAHACGIYHVAAVRMNPTKVNLQIRTQYARDATLHDVRSLLWNVIAEIAREVAEIDRIQSLRKLLPIEPTCTGM